MTDASLNAVAIRSRLILEIASELVAGKDRSIRVAEVCALGREHPLQRSSHRARYRRAAMRIQLFTRCVLSRCGISYSVERRRSES